MEKLVFRVASKENFKSGFYQTGRVVMADLMDDLEYDLIYQWGDHTPPPHRDQIEYFDGTQHFGFQSIDHLKNWFRDDAMAGLELVDDFHVYVVAVPEDAVAHGQKQCVFDINRARVIEALHPRELKKIEKKYV